MSDRDIFFKGNESSLLNNTDRKIKYRIIREVNTVKFEDINEITEKNEYVIEILNKINPEEKYYLEVPFYYFRIPEEVRIKINPQLMEINSKELFEKIIWYYIFEVIYGDKDKENHWNEIRNKIKNNLKVKDSDLILNNTPDEKELLKEIKRKIKEIDLKRFIEDEGTFEEILIYPQAKKKKFLQNKYFVKSVNIFIGTLFIILFTFLFFNFSKFDSINGLLMVFFLIGIGVFLLIFNFLSKFSVMKRGELKKKFETSFKHFLDNNFTIHKLNNFSLKRYYDLHSSDLFRTIYYSVYNEFYESIKDYKSFNPISINIEFEDRKIITEKTDNAGFFHKPTIFINFKDTPIQPKYSLKIETKRTLRNIKKKERITEENLVYPQFIFFFLVIMLMLPWLFEIIFIHLEFNYLLYFTFFALVLFFHFGLIKCEYRYYSPLQEKYKKIKHRAFGLFHFLNVYKDIYSIPTSIRPGCSYYWLIYAPKFHKIKMTKELKEILKKLDRPIVLRTPYRLSRNILSYHIPRNEKIEEMDFQLDLELPYATRIIGWLIGMNVMLTNMLVLSVIILILVFSSNEPVDPNNIRFVLPFLTLLIGFFGKSILEEPTKDLQKWGGLLIVLTVIIGILFFFSTILSFLLYS